MTKTHNFKKIASFLIIAAMLITSVGAVFAEVAEIDDNEEIIENVEDTDEEEVDTDEEEVDTDEEEVDTDEEEVDTDEEEVDTEEEEVDTEEEEVDTEEEEVDTEEETVTFSDIEGHWAADRILIWAENDVVRGYPDGSFKPENNITRAEFMSIVNKTMGYITEVEIDYSDVDADAWYAAIVARAKAAGYISGYEDGTMRPDNFITREEVASIIRKITELEQNEEAAEVFADEISSWAKGHVGAVADARYMNGYLSGDVRTFGAKNNIKRAETVVVIHNLFRDLEDLEDNEEEIIEEDEDIEDEDIIDEEDQDQDEDQDEEEPIVEEDENQDEDNQDEDNEDEEDTTEEETDLEEDEENTEED